FDGELSIELMESVTSHLASCVTCAAAARELEEESALLTSAFAAEFKSSVPTERLRQRIDAAVLGERIAVAQSPQKTGFFAGFFNFGTRRTLGYGTQRTLGYVSLAVVLALAAILGLVNLVKMRTTTETEPAVANTPVQPGNKQVATISTTKDEIPPAVIAPQTKQKTSATPHFVKAAVKNSDPKPAPVKLLPGERTYLQTIARLDTTINSDKKAMRPSLQVEYERNLAVVDRAIAATRSAAKSNPNDPDAADFMFAAYQSKVDLLNTIADARLGGGRGH
ncbi:MAG TPA: hypothetical protein VKA97_03665, partial [Pyrinomonadaceae bacterium]|nr:hypothetical protein [Pyrinomonadaceae bacterium]